MQHNVDALVQSIKILLHITKASPLMQSVDPAGIKNLEFILGPKSVTMPQTLGANRALSKQQRPRITTDTEKIMV
jgi:hypothetical protein